MDEKRRIVVVGEGFVGGAILRKCISMGENCMSITRADADLSCPTSVDKLRKLIMPSDYLVFSAAKAPAKSFEDYLQKNLEMVKNFVSACMSCKPAYILNISSDAIYADHKTLIDEKSLALPDNYHGLMHLSREMLLKINGLNGDLRPTLIYGTDDPHNSYGPNSFYRLAIKNENIVLYGEGEELRDHVHIDDVSTLAYMMLSETRQGDFNAVTGEVISFFDIAKIITEATKSNSKIVTTQREGSMPHGGYRAFQNKKVRDVFTKFSFKSFKDGVKYFGH